MSAGVLPLATVGIVILIAIIFSVIFRKMGQNAVIGFIVAGFVLGPFAVNFLHPTDPLVVGFAELGLFVLLFYLGIELSLKQFLKSGSATFGLALIDMCFSSGFGILVMLLLGQSLMFAIIVGIMLFCTSTAIVAKFILDKKMMNDAAPKTALSILILQDFLGIMLLVFVTSTGTQGSGLGLALTAMVFSVSAFYAVHKLSRFVENWMFENNLGHTEVTLYALGIGLLVATLGSMLGLSTAIGAYFAGFALSETKAGDKIKKDVGFLRDFFLVFFFVGFGTTIFYSVEAAAIVIPPIEQLMFLAGLAVVLSIGAFMAHSLSFRIFGNMFGLDAKASTQAPILLLPLGEFVVIIATIVAVTGAATAEQSAILSPLAFLLILITVIMFQPLWNLQHLHQKIFSIVPAIKAVPRKVSAIKKYTPHSVKLIKKFVKNAFIVLCLADITIILYDAIPRFGIPVPYGRQVTAIIIFAIFAIWPAVKAFKHLKSLLYFARTGKVAA